MAPELTRWRANDQADNDDCGDNEKRRYPVPHPPPNKALALLAVGHLAFPGTLFVSAFGDTHEGHTSPMYQVTESPHGALYPGIP